MIGMLPQIVSLCIFAFRIKILNGNPCAGLIVSTNSQVQDQEVKYNNKENKSISISPVSGCVEVNSIRVCQNNEVPVLT